MAIDSDQGLLATKRGKLLHLCVGPPTVNELAEQLDLTDNAGRAQLESLQTSGLVRQAGLGPGTRKPHVDYELTPAVRQFFPTAHRPVLGALIAVPPEGLAPPEMRSLLEQVGLRPLTAWLGELREQEPKRRTATILQNRAAVPGVALEKERDRYRVRDCACPLASVTAEHPEICDLLSGVLGDIVGTPVRERCNRTESPRCCFAVPRTSSSPRDSGKHPLFHHASGDDSARARPLGDSTVFLSMESDLESREPQCFLLQRDL
jgi:predicted ArsR family transcriptional regulator